MLENAKFITTANPEDSVAPVFRTAFVPKGEIRSASLTVTARGIYEARINGARVGRFIFAPGWTSYKNRLQVQTYDVTAMLSENNELDILLGRGWHYGEIGRGVFSPICDPCIIASLDVTYANGTTESVVTDETWQYAKTGILYSDFYNGETFDENQVYGDWKPAVVTDGKREALVEQQGEIVSEIEEISARSYFITPKGERIIDFGQEVTGYVCFRSVGEIGSRIAIDHAEILDKDGNFYTENYRDAKSRIVYISDGDTKKWYHPVFSFFGFRYIRLTEYPTKDIYLGDFKAIVVHSDMKRTGRFTCSDPLVNRLYENVVWGQRCNFLDVPTDCPQRDERLGWTGDANVFCRTATYNYDVNKFFHKWLYDLKLDQAEDGRVAGVVPVLWGQEGSFGWGDAATVCPWEVYRTYGDVSILTQQYDSMKKWCDYCYGKGGAKDWGNGAQWGDWLGLDAAEGSYHGATDNLLLGATFLAYTCDIIVKTAKVLGREDDVALYTARRAEIGRGFCETYIGEDGYLTCDTQTAYVCTLKFGLAPDPAKFAAHLVEKIHENGDHIQTGFLGTPYIMDALSENGYADVAYSLLLQQDFPSWLYPVRKGATTIWEHWDGLKPDGSVWSADMNSFNHYAYGAVAAWMYGTMCGISPDEDRPGYANVKIAPIPDGRFDYAYAELDTKYGTVKSGWKKTAEGFEIAVTVPTGATADITVGGVTKHVTAGEYTYTV